MGIGCDVGSHHAGKGIVGPIVEIQAIGLVPIADDDIEAAITIDIAECDRAGVGSIVVEIMSLDCGERSARGC